MSGTRAGAGSAIAHAEWVVARCIPDDGPGEMRLALSVPDGREATLAAVEVRRGATGADVQLLAIARGAAAADRPLEVSIPDRTALAATSRGAAASLGRRPPIAPGSYRVGVFLLATLGRADAATTVSVATARNQHLGGGGMPPGTRIRVVSGGAMHRNGHGIHDVRHMPAESEFHQKVIAPESTSNPTMWGLVSIPGTSLPVTFPNTNVLVSRGTDSIVSDSNWLLVGSSVPVGRIQIDDLDGDPEDEIVFQWVPNPSNQVVYDETLTIDFVDPDDWNPLLFTFPDTSTHEVEMRLDSGPGYQLP